jgi:antitoxin ParD1/3/4
MPTRNINLTPQLDKFVESRIKRGHYANASEVNKAEKEDEAKLDALRVAVLAGEESGIAEGDVFGELRDRVRMRARMKRGA